MYKVLLKYGAKVELEDVVDGETTAVATSCKSAKKTTDEKSAGDHSGVGNIKKGRGDKGWKSTKRTHARVEGDGDDVDNDMEEGQDYRNNKRFKKEVKAHEDDALIQRGEDGT